MKRCLRVLLISVAFAALSFDSSRASAEFVIIDEFRIPTGNSRPVGIAAGPDGNLWFTEAQGNNIGRITPAGGVTGEFGIPTAASSPAGILSGPDGNLWFAETQGLNIGRMTPAGGVTGEFPVLMSNCFPHWMTIGPDGNLWFTCAGSSSSQLGRITPAGVVTGFTVSTPNTGLGGITVGPDGNLWFTERGANKIGRITPFGTDSQIQLSIQEFGGLAPNSGPAFITAGPDGNLWFTEDVANQIGQITPTGVITEFPIPTPNSQPQGIEVGPDGNLWFTEYSANKIGRITTTGIFREFLVPTPDSQPFIIALGPDGNLWFTELNANQIGRVRLLADPGLIPPTLRVSLATPGAAVEPPELILSWDASCSPAAQDYAIYEGLIGNWNSHTAVDCLDDGLPLTETVMSSSGNRYYLVVPHHRSVEGSYGTNSLAVERPRGAATCVPAQVISACP